MLAIWDPKRERAIDLEVQWERGHDVDAKIKIPKRYEARWRAVVRAIRRDHRGGRGSIRPYSSLPISVDVSKLLKSTTGFYAIASELFRGIGWRVPPPFPEVDEDEPPNGAVE